MTGKLDPEFREWLTKEKLKFSLSSRFLVRFHVFLILSAAVVAGSAADRAMYEYGIGNMAVRLPSAVVAGYLGFLGGLRLWIGYSGIREYLDTRKAQELLEPPGFRLPEEKPMASKWYDWVDVPWVDNEGCLILIVAIVVAAVLYAIAGYMIVHAADVLAEVVFELLLAAGLIKGIRRIDSAPYASLFPATSIWACLTALVASLAFGLFARYEYPQATKVSEVIKAMVQPRHLR